MQGQQEGISARISKMGKNVNYITDTFMYLKPTKKLLIEPKSKSFETIS